MTVKHRFFCLLITLSLAITPTAFAKSPQRGLTVVADSNTWGKYHALLIGINDYQAWPRLRTAVKDATVIRDILVSRYGFDKRNVILRTDQNASRLQIIKDLRYLAQSMRENDNLFIYYAGHGQLDDFTGDGYWVPAEGELKSPGTWLANSYIKAVLSSEKLQAKNVVIIADSCYSGSMLRGGPSLMSMDDRRYREKLVQKAALRSRQVISSGGVEPVADGGAEGHSLFAYYLIDALRKNSREVIDLENLLHTKVWKPVTEIGNQRPNVGRLKTPMDQDGQFVLYNVSVARAQSSVNAKQASLEKAIVADRTTLQNLNAEEETWEIVKTSSEPNDFAMFLKAYPDSRFKTAANLKIQQLKRKRNAQALTASVVPSVVMPEPTKHANAPAASKTNITPRDSNYTKYSKNQASPGSLQTAQNRYRLALFPVKISSTWGKENMYHNDVIRTIASISEDDDKLEFTSSYKEVEGLPGNVKLIADIVDKEENQVWTKKTFFSQYEPDWAQLKKVGMKINTDLAVLISIRIDTTSEVDVFLYDFKQAKAYSRENRVISYNDVPDGVRQNVLQTLKGIFRRQ